MDDLKGSLKSLLGCISITYLTACSASAPQRSDETQGGSIQVDLSCGSHLSSYGLAAVSSAGLCESGPNGACNGNGPSTGDQCGHCCAKLPWQSLAMQLHIPYAECITKADIQKYRAEHPDATDEQVNVAIGAHGIATPDCAFLRSALTCEQIGETNRAGSPRIQYVLAFSNNESIDPKFTVGAVSTKDADKCVAVHGPALNLAEITDETRKVRVLKYADITAEGARFSPTTDYSCGDLAKEYWGTDTVAGNEPWKDAEDTTQGGLDGRTTIGFPTKDGIRCYHKAEANRAYTTATPFGRTFADVTSTQDFGASLYKVGHMGQDYLPVPASETLNVYVQNIAPGQVIGVTNNKHGYGGAMLIRHVLPDGTIIFSALGHVDPRTTVLKFGDWVGRGQPLIKLISPSVARQRGLKYDGTNSHFHGALLDETLGNLVWSRISDFGEVDFCGYNSGWTSYQAQNYVRYGEPNSVPAYTGAPCYETGSYLNYGRFIKDHLPQTLGMPL